MGVILGNGELLCLEVGIPLDAGQAAKALLESEKRSISLGKAGETYFLLMAGIGFDAEIVHRLEDTLSWKRKLGKTAYLLIGLKSLWSIARPSFASRWMEATRWKGTPRSLETRGPMEGGFK